MDVRLRTPLRFAFLTALALGIVLGLVWAIVLRERSVRRLYLEYETYQASAALLEAFRQDSTILPDDERVLGFGIYAQDGRALVRSGTAPQGLGAEDLLGEPSIFDIRRASLVMKRPLGPTIPGMPALRLGRGMGGMMRQPQGGDFPQLLPFGQAGPEQRRQRAGLPAPRSLWIEYALGSFWRERGLLLFGALVATAGAVALYLVLLGLYRRNLDLRSREARNRELLQLGEAASTLVHEIKNPLGIIRIQAASLRRLSSPEASAKADAIEEEVVRLAGLADRIRGFLKGGEGDAVDIDLVPWLRDYVSRWTSASASASISVSASEATSGTEAQNHIGSALLGKLPKSAMVHIDPERLAQALDNLVVNAGEASPAGQPPEISLTGKGSHHGLWELEVADRGPGVPPEISGRIFEPFFTTKTQGSGIGLALARRIARAGGGELLYRPRTGGGAVFVLQLPMGPSSATGSQGKDQGVR